MPRNPRRRPDDDVSRVLMRAARVCSRVMIGLVLVVGDAGRLGAAASSTSAATNLATPSISELSIDTGQMNHLGDTRRYNYVILQEYMYPRVAEIKRARRVVKGPFSAMKGQLPRALTLKQHEALGLNAAWYTFLPDLVLKTAVWSFFQEFKNKDMRAWDEFAAAHIGTPFTGGGKLPWDATGMTELSKLEASYAMKSRRN